MASLSLRSSEYRHHLRGRSGRHPQHVLDAVAFDAGLHYFAMLSVSVHVDALDHWMPWIPWTPWMQL